MIASMETIPTAIAILITVLIFILGYWMGCQSGRASTMERLASWAYNTGTIKLRHESYRLQKIDTTELWGEKRRPDGTQIPPHRNPTE